MNFKIKTNLKLTGDQPKVINELTTSIKNGNKYQTLLGVTGSGKTFTMANIIKNINKPTLVISHNKTLAAQLYSEFKDLFPNNAVEYFVSYYKHFQPEAYIPSQDKYIAKESVINKEIDRMRQHCIQSLLTRKDVIVVASVSALFGLGSPSTFYNTRLVLKKNQKITRENILIDLIKKRYERSDSFLSSGTFRVLGDIIDIMLSIDTNIYYKIEMFDNEIEHIYKINNNTNEKIEEVSELNVFNTSSYTITDDNLETLCNLIKEELLEVYNNFLNNGEELYANRILERTMFDIEMIKEIGYCKGLENYQRYLTNKPIGTPPTCLIDFFPKDYLMFIDESHVTLPQIKSIGNQNSTLKENLINYGFRLPSCIDNRPLNFKEFEEKQNQVIYVSATPDSYELSKSTFISEQLIRPTGILDPKVIIKPIIGQIDSVIEEINKTVSNNGKVLISVITKKLAEDLCDYIIDVGIKACYLHSAIQTIDRIDIINDLQQDKYDVLVGCNLLREGLSISNCQLVIILDADKEGFLRNKTSLMQIIGRAARNINGRAIMYANKMTKSMQYVVDEVNRHRNIQMNYNKIHHVIPTSTNIKLIKNIIGIKEDNIENFNNLSNSQIIKLKEEYYKYMKMASKELNFEEAIKYRNLIKKLENVKNCK